jgi:hypothetical protein
MKGGSLLAIMVLGLGLWIWEMMHHWWFWAAAACACLVVWYRSQTIRGAPQKTSAQIAPTSLTQTSCEFKNPDMSAYAPRIFVDDQGMLSMTLPDDASLPPPTGDAQLDALQRTRILDQWDAARRKLQQISYGMVSETPEAKASFTKFMKVFAERDPLLSSVLGTLMPIIRSNPGVLQTALYKHVPGVEVEEVRYVLYFAEQLQLVRREKKGNTYRLLPIGEVIDVAST